MIALIISVCVPGVFALAGRVWIGTFVGSASCIAFLYFQFNSEQGLQSFDFVVFSGAAVWFSVVSAALGWTVRQLIKEIREKKAAERKADLP